ncbi:MAG TPA: c-type cytochrome domain-containing protein, partial [Schlesneria sp.]
MSLPNRCFLALLLLPATLAVGEDVPKSDYTTQVKPLLAKHCLQCHGPEKQQSGLRIDSGRAIVDGGDSGPALVARDPARSLLIQAVTGAEGASKMPPEGPRLSDAEIQVLKDW